MSEYTHTLISEKVNFVPDPSQVETFLGTLTSLGAAPLQPTITVGQLSGKVNTFKNPFTGETTAFPQWKGKQLKNLSQLTAALRDLDDYNVYLAGKGPPKVPAFTFQFKGPYGFSVHCSLRANVVSMSDWHGDVRIKRKVKFFGEPCNPKARMGVFTHPETLQAIEVPNAGCARFWIEFEFGKMLFPKIKDKLDLFAPSIVKAAQESFGIGFVQGCHWDA